MAGVALDTLVDALQVAVNVPGATTVTDDDDGWTIRLANAFWTAYLDGFFQPWLLNTTGDTIVPVTDGGADMPRQFQQIIVMAAAMDVLEMRAINLPNSKTAKAGPLESSQSTAATTINQILAARRADLVRLRNELIGSPFITGTYVIDSVIARNESIADGLTEWLA